MLKIGKAGRAPLLDFLQLAFGRRLPTAVPAANGTTPSPTAPYGTLATLAPGLFGGADPKGDARFLSAPHGFDASRMRAAAAVLPPSFEEEESLGAGLAAAVYACRLPWSKPSKLAEQPPLGLASEADEAAATAASEAFAQVSVACDGLCASNEVNAPSV